MKSIFAIIGALASAVTIITGIAILIKWIYRKLTTASPEQKLKYRMNLRDDFLKNVMGKDQCGLVG